MKNSLLIASFLKVSYSNVEMKMRKFDCPSVELKNHLESVGRNFLDGYHKAIYSKDLDPNFSLNHVYSMYRGFAYEGAAMGLMMNDLLGFDKKGRIHHIIKSHPEHDYMLHVGAGWAFARIPFYDIEKKINQFDPLLKWLIIDGYGFHQAYFKTKRYVHDQVFPKEFKKEKCIHAFYQGIGRALWFVFGGQPMKIKNKIDCFDSKFAPDLWSGVGLAAGYAGGVSISTLHTLKKISEIHLSELAQGVSFACKARIKAKIMMPHTEKAAEVFMNCSPLEASRITDYCLREINAHHNDESYFQWRKNITKRITNNIALC